MRPFSIAVWLACATASLPVGARGAVADPPSLIQTGCDTGITGNRGPCKQARIAGARFPSSYPIC
jgi:hypothetical protein